MMPRVVPLLILLLILLPETSLGRVTSIEKRIKPVYMVSKMHARELLVATLDYDYGKPNCKHDPSKKLCKNP